MNIILLTVDALRFDHLSLYDYEVSTFPKLEPLNDESAHFTRTFSVSSHTREAVPGLLTGQFPDEAVSEGYHLDTETVAEPLRDAGYQTGAFHSNPFSSRAYGFDDSFDTFDDDLYLGNSKLIALAQRLWDKIRNEHYVRAAEINRRSLSWIDNLDREPFFLWNHYMDAHGPYEPPETIFKSVHNISKPDINTRKLHRRSINNPESITPQEREQLIELYDAEIRYVHKHISTFLEALEDRDLLASSLVIITADHGEGFGENGYYSHPRYLHDDLTHVPLIVSGPELPSGTYDAPVSTLDIVPTILQAAKETGSEGFPGMSLQNITTNSESMTDRVVFSQTRGEDDESELIRYSARTADDMASLVWDTTDDTFEIRDETSDSTLREALHSHASERNKTTARSAEPDELSSDVKERLEVLGYRE
ncbi:sulfatase-like hydrolase/transferase [Halomicrobium mukohataei]|uniref:Sulfatase-like hydrolase/transferase n=1 Tax=Halomicrobium mukohataei TaxID=57705 RepID=A0A847U4Y5_9EURY|nr:sulfatase [Halomicrobium mukohataei]NLV08385.1 sulfatase-like hydrolase/transferase [Halomicrobium mukohataei]